MNPARGLIMYLMSIFLVTVLNAVLNSNSKFLKKEIRWQHYIFGYLFIFYLMINLSEVVGFPSLSEWERSLTLNEPIFNPHINLVPFKYGLEISGLLNIILFMPFGFLLPTLWEKYRDFWSTFYYGLFFSFSIEISQLFVRRRETDINDLIMNIVGTIFGWVIFNIMRKVFCKLTNKTAVNILPNDTLAIKLEPYLYIGIAVICSFLR